MTGIGSGRMGRGRCGVAGERRDRGVRWQQQVLVDAVGRIGHEHVVLDRGRDRNEHDDRRRAPRRRRPRRRARRAAALWSLPERRLQRDARHRQSDQLVQRLAAEGRVEDPDRGRQGDLRRVLEHPGVRAQRHRLPAGPRQQRLRDQHEDRQGGVAVQGARRAGPTAKARTASHSSATRSTARPTVGVRLAGVDRRAAVEDAQTSPTRPARASTSPRRSSTARSTSPPRVRSTAASPTR